MDRFILHGDGVHYPICFSFVALVSSKSLPGISQREKPQRFELRVPVISDASRLTFGALPFASLAPGCNPANLGFALPPFPRTFPLQLLGVRCSQRISVRFR